MINLIEDWAVLEKCAGDGFYQLVASDGSFEIRVMTEGLGFKREFKDGNDKLLNQILEFCKRRCFIEVISPIKDGDFFT